MVMSQKAIATEGIQLDLSVQDHFWESDQLTDRGSSPVEPETWDNWFRRWLELLGQELPPAAAYELSLRLSDDLQIQALNSRYRYQDKPTDVLAFAALEVNCPQPDEALLPSNFYGESLLPLYLGDIVISVETARSGAKNQGHSLEIELATLAVHGLLHLLGWDHPDSESLGKMLARQETLLQAVDLIS